MDIHKFPRNVFPSSEQILHETENIDSKSAELNSPEISCKNCGSKGSTSGNEIKNNTFIIINMNDKSSIFNTNNKQEDEKSVMNTDKNKISMELFKKILCVIFGSNYNTSNILHYNIGKDLDNNDKNIFHPSVEAVDTLNNIDKDLDKNVFNLSILAKDPDDLSLLNIGKGLVENVFHTSIDAEDSDDFSQSNIDKGSDKNVFDPSIEVKDPDFLSVFEIGKDLVENVLQTSTEAVDADFLSVFEIGKDLVENVFKTTTEAIDLDDELSEFESEASSSPENYPSGIYFNCSIV